MTRRRILVAACFLVLFASAATTDVALACPMCQEANETDVSTGETNHRPRAYMYSILFMLAVPATLFTGFSVSFYRLSKQSQSPADDQSSALSNSTTSM